MTTVEPGLAAEFAVAADELAAGVTRRPSVRRAIEGDAFSREAWAAVTDAGWAEILLPAEAGGLGLGLAELGPIFQAVGRYLLPGPLLEHIVAIPMLLPGFRAQVRERLAETLTTSRLVALVDASATGSPGRAVVLDEDSRLSGRLAGVRFGDLADELVVVAESRDGPIVLAVPAGRPGITVFRQRSLDPSVRYAEVQFDQVTVEADERGELGGLLDEVRATLRIAIAAELSGIAAHASATALAYAKEREQFGQPIGAFQAIQQILAEMERESQGAQALVRESLLGADRTPNRRSTIALVAKSGVARATRAVVEDALQVHGGVAFTIEHELHRYYKHVLGLEPLYGGPRDLWRELGGALLAPGGESWPTW